MGPVIEKRGRKPLLTAQHTGGGAIPYRVLHRKWQLGHLCLASTILSSHIGQTTGCFALCLFVGLGPVLALSAAASLLVWCSYRELGRIMISA